MSDFEEKYQSNYIMAIIPEKVDNSAIEKKIQSFAKCTQKVGFTLTFSRMWQEEDPDTLYRYIQKYIKEYFDKIDYVVVPEFTSSGIMHFHGIIYNCYQRVINKVLNEWRKLYGYIKIENHITDKWEKYICKDINEVGYAVITNI